MELETRSATCHVTSHVVGTSALMEGLKSTLMQNGRGTKHRSPTVKGDENNFVLEGGMLHPTT